MKASKVYLKAAELVDSGRQPFSCLAVEEARGGPWFFVDSELRRRYVNTILGTDNPDVLFDPQTDDDTKRNIRVLALCLMAAIAADEERAP